MGLLIAFVFVCWLFKKAAEDTYNERAQRGREPAGAGPRVPKYGMWDHLRDNYRDSWRRQTDDMIVKRDARAAERRATGTDRRTWRERAEDDVASRREPKRRQDPTPSTTTTTSTTTRDTAGSASPDPAAVDPHARPMRVRPRAAEETPSAGAAPPDATKTSTPPPTPEGDGPDRDLGLWDADPRESDPDDTKSQDGHDSPPTHPTSKGDTMGQPTGEVLNHETHIAQIDQQIDQIKKGIDLTQAALSASREARARVDEVQAIYGPVASAAQSHNDHLTALKLDETTRGHAAEAADALTPGKVDGYYDAAEQIEAGLVALLKSLEQALASKENERAEAIKRYADAQDTVNANLGGDSSYLHNGGASATTVSTTTAPAPQPEPAGAR